VTERTSVLRGNVPVVLDGEATVRVVESGSVAVFCAEVTDGVPTGPRRPLFRLAPGQAACSVPARGDGLQFLIVPVKEAVVREVPLGELWSTDGAPDAQYKAERRRVVDEWIDLLARLLSHDEAPKLPLRVAGKRELSLEEGQTLCGDRGRVLWACVADGTASVLGRPELALERGESVPLGEGMWLEATGDATVRASTAEKLDDEREVEASLGALSELVLDHLQAEIEREQQSELARLGERDRVQEREKQAALLGLASVLERRRSTEFRETPLLTALSLVGASMGIEILPPAKSEEAKGGGNSLEAIARSSRIRTRRVTLSGKWWKRDCGSLLGWSADEERRPLALLRTRRLRYEIRDPSRDSSEPVDARTAQGLAPEAVMLYRPLPEGKLRLVDLFRFSLDRRSRELALVVLTGVVATLLGMVTPQAIAVLMDNAIPDANPRLLIELGAGLIAAAFGQTIFSLSQGIVLMRIGVGSEAESQAALWDRLLRLRPSFFRRFSSGDLQSRVMAVNEVGRELSGTTLTTLFSSFLALLNLLLLYYYSPSLARLAVFVGLVVMVFTTSIGLLIRKKIRDLMELEGKLFGFVVQLINGVGKLRVAGAGDRVYVHWMRRYAPQLKLRSDTYALHDSLTVFNQIVPPLSSVALFLLAFQMLSGGGGGAVSTGLTLGTFLAFNAAYGAFLGGITSLSSTAVGFMDLHAKGRRIRPILEEEAEIDRSKADPGRLTGRLAMHGVDFRYGEDGPKILEDMSFRAEPGEFVAIVGPSGSGKSTALRLLLGFETPDAGTVTYDGQDLANLDVLAVRRQFGVVLQGGQLDAGSIFENIASGDVITLDQAWAAAEDAGFAEEVRQMPMGMHTIISVGGGNLSGGQRQRLLIARALAQRPRILLFDEATSALDNRTQAIVSESLERLNVTRVVIAHRLSTIKNADRIYVVEGGRIVQKGRFADLMKQEDGLFMRMMRRQIA